MRSVPVVAAFSFLALAACGGGGGGGSSSGGLASRATLLSVTFPDPSDVNVEPTNAAPQNAPLVQQVVLTFTGSPDPARIGPATIPIRDSNGFSAPGNYDVSGTTVTFTPTLPTRPVTQISDTQFDGGGAGLQPGTTYTLRIGPSTLSFVAKVAPALLLAFPDTTDPTGIVVKFATTKDPTLFHKGLAARTPALLEADPADGSTGVSPGLFTDPDHLFPPKQTFSVRFDGPVDPALTNVNGDVFHLIDLDDLTAAFPAGIPLGIDVTILENELDHSLLQIAASGILPFGNQLALEYPTDLRGLGQTGAPVGPFAVATTFTVATAPNSTVNDTVAENFDTTTHEETDSTQIPAGTLLPDWDRLGSGVLTAGFAFQGSGQIGRFIPPPPAAGDTSIITLDTSSQTFPLFDGSTPDAPPGLVITGGVFPFTDIDIPAGVTINPIGPNPLVFTATGSVHLAGKITVKGDNGTADYAYDSAVTSVPGGPPGSGGGRGGVGHPIVFYPPDVISLLSMVSPLTGENGWGYDATDGVLRAIGGAGGSCGIKDAKDTNGNYSTDQEIDCNETGNNGNGSKGAGGGGGSLLIKGTRGIDGVGNVYPDGTGKWIVVDDNSAEPPLPAGIGGSHPFYDDGNANNDFIGPLGQVTRWIGGQGGGGGGSKTEAYYCGRWCKLDSDKNNDKCCKGGEFGGAFADSVGDARGGGGGGGGGVFVLQALGAIDVDNTASIIATGGIGAGGEAISCSNWGGSSGGASGGTIILESASSVTVQPNAFLDLRGGLGANASKHTNYLDCDNNVRGHRGQGGDGGLGILQLQVPIGQTATVVNASFSIPKDGSGNSPWVDQQNVLNPAEFTPFSVALSKWYDFGRVIARPPANTNPVLSFGGLDGLGYVKTDGSGNVLDPAHTDVECDYLGQIDPTTKQYKPGQFPKADFIPTNAKIKVEFQGADALVEGSKEVDPASLTAWSASAAAVSGKQFLRWRITFNLNADGSSLSPDTPRPTVQNLAIHAQF